MMICTPRRRCLKVTHSYQCCLVEPRLVYLIDVKKNRILNLEGTIMTNSKNKELQFKAIKSWALYQRTKELYKASFPPEERFSFFYLYLKSMGKKADFLAAYDDDNYLGFVYLTYYKDIMYIFFFAVTEEYRGQEYGSLILKILQKKYQDKRISLFIESTQGNFNNLEMRIRRKNFYIRNGFQTADYQIVENNISYELLYYGNFITKDEMHQLLKNYAGSLLYYLLYQRRGEKK